MEELIREFLSPENQGQPRKIKAIEKAIQELQSHHEAWEKSFDLLNANDDVLRFYGASTLRQKIKSDWKTDGIGSRRDVVARLLEELVSKYVVLVKSGASNSVTSTLAKTLAALFATGDAAWALPVRHIFSCFLLDKYVSQHEALGIEEILKSHSVIARSDFAATLLLAKTMHDECLDEHGDFISHKIEVQLSNNALDVWRLTAFGFLQLAGPVPKHVEPVHKYAATIAGVGQPSTAQIYEVICQTIPSWTKFVDNQKADPFRLSELFSYCLDRTTSALHDPSDNTEYAIACIQTLTSEYHTLLRRLCPNFLSSLVSSPAGARWADECFSGDASREAFIWLEALDAVVEHLDLESSKQLFGSQSYQELLRILQRLLHSNGVAAVEDQTCRMVLNMVIVLVEGLTNWLPSEPHYQEMQSFASDACAAILRKISLPESELDAQSQTWDPDDRTNFMDYRFDACDLFQTAFGPLGPSLPLQIAESTLTTSWSGFEAALYVLICLADAIEDRPDECDACFQKVFRSPRWQQGIMSNSQAPGKVRKIMIKLLTENTNYLQRNTDQIIPCLDFLFRMLAEGEYVTTASEAIYKLCFHQRALLAPALKQFLHTLAALQALPRLAIFRTLSAVACLIQACPDKNQQRDALHILLDLVEVRGKVDLNIAEQDNEESSPLLDQVEMLAYIAKGMQVPADTPVDVDAVVQSDFNTDYWTNGPGHGLQDRYFTMLQSIWFTAQSLPNTGGVAGPICDILRCGFKERHPSPLKLNDNMSAVWMTSMLSCAQANLDYSVVTAIAYLAGQTSEELNAGLEQITLKLCDLINVSTDQLLVAHSNQAEDPVVLEDVLEFFSRLFIKYCQHVFKAPESPLINGPIRYALILLKGADSHARKKSAAFFTSLAGLAQNDFYMIANHAPTQAGFEAVANHWTPIIIGATMHLICGECQRSELETLTETLRKFLVARPLQTKRVLDQVIKAESNVLSARCIQATTPELRTRLISQIKLSNGDRRTTNNITKEFWLKSRGDTALYLT